MSCVTHDMQHLDFFKCTYCRHISGLAVASWYNQHKHYQSPPRCVEENLCKELVVPPYLEKIQNQAVQTSCIASCMLRRMLLCLHLPKMLLKCAFNSDPTAFNATYPHISQYLPYRTTLQCLPSAQKCKHNKSKGKLSRHTATPSSLRLTPQPINNLPTPPCTHHAHMLVRVLLCEAATPPHRLYQARGASGGDMSQEAGRDPLRGRCCCEQTSQPDISKVLHGH